MNEFYLDKICIVGVGLIGGSLAKKIRQEKLAGTIIGWGRSERNLQLALAHGLIDGYSLDLAEAMLDAALIILATPVKAMPQIAAEISPFLNSNIIVTDVGSVKGWVVEQMERIMPEYRGFVPAHPIAGSEKSGMDASRVDLFVGAKCILTPTDKTDQRSLEIVENMWKKMGSFTVRMSPQEHDYLLAAVSHLPHVLAYTLVGTAGDAALNLCGGGFRDTTRIALSDPQLWKDICLTNKEMLINHLDRFIDNIKRVRFHIEQENTEELGLEFSKAQVMRNKLISSGG